MRRRTAVAVATVTAAALLPLTAACSAIDKAIDCGQLAIDITADAQTLSEALGNAGDSPQAAKDALDELDGNLDKLGDKTDNADVKKAVEDLADQVTETRNALEDGRVPSGRPVVDAAEEVANVCSPG
jgi:ABC-type transporter Mla subunit MlaD